MTRFPDLREVQPREGLRLWLRYSDGTEGVVDLSSHARRGAFKLWDTPGEFEKVHLGSSGEVAWNNELDLCPDALYLKLTGISPEDFFERRKAVNA